MASVGGNIVANFFGKAWGALLNIALTPLYIRFLGMESYGLVGFFATLVGVLSLLDLGLGSLLNRELARLSATADEGRGARMRDTVRTLEVVYWAVGLVAAGAVVVVAPLVAGRWFHAEQLQVETVTRSVRLMGLVFALQWPSVLYAGGVTGLQRQVAVNVVNAVVGTVRGGGAVLVLLLVSPTVDAFFAWQAVASVVLTVATRTLLASSLPAGRGSFRRDVLAEHWRLAAGMTGISLLAVILTQLDKILLSNRLTLVEFGYYALAGAVANALLQLVGPVGTATFPRVCQLVKLDDQVELRRLYHRASQLLAVMLLPAAIVLCLFSREVLELWTGDAGTAARAWPLVSLLVIGSALNGLLNMPGSLQLAYGWVSLGVIANTVAVVVLVPLIFVLTGTYGAVGGALAWTVLNVGIMTISVAVMHRRLLKGEELRWYLVDIGLPAVAALAVAIPARLLLAEGAPKATAFAVVALASALSLAAAIAAAGEVRSWVLARLRPARPGGAPAP